MRNMFPKNSSELSWLRNNSELRLVRIRCSSVKQKQWKHQQAALNFPVAAERSMSTVFKVRGRSEHRLRTAMIRSMRTQPEHHPPRGRRRCVRVLFRLRRFLFMREVHVKASFVRGIYSSLKDYSFFFLLKARKQNVTTVISSAVALRHYLPSCT